jgi:hypothetical protein
VAASWTADEDRALRALYGTQRLVNDIAAALGRSPDAVTARRRQIGLAPRDQAWTAREDALLRAAAASGVPATWVARRLSRTPDAVRWRQRALVGPRSSAVPYTPAEDEAIRRCFADRDDPAALARRLGRSVGALRRHAETLGAYRPVRRAPWSPAEDAIVRDGYADGKTCAAISRALPGRSPTSVAARARGLGLSDYARRWTAADDALLTRLTRARTPLPKVARALVRTPEAIRRRCRRLGLEPPPAPQAARSGKPWTASEDALLRLHAGLNTATLAEQLGRSDHAITCRMRTLGLRDERRRSPHHPPARARGLTPAQRSAIRRAPDPLKPTSVAALARRLDLPPARIREVAALASPNGSATESDSRALVSDHRDASESPLLIAGRASRRLS